MVILRSECDASGHGGLAIEESLEATGSIGKAFEMGEERAPRQAVGCGGASRAQLGVRPWLGATPPSRAATLQISASPPRLSASRPAAAAPRTPLAARHRPPTHAHAPPYVK